MAETKYWETQGKNNSGKIGLNRQVFGLIAKNTIEECEDVSIDPNSRNFFSFGKGPIICDLNNGKISISVEVKVKYGKNVNRTTRQLQQRIVNAIANMCDVQVSAVNVKVVGIDF